MPTARRSSVSQLTGPSISMMATALLLGQILGCNETAKQAAQPDAGATAQLTKQPLMPSNAPVGAAAQGAATPAGAKSASGGQAQPIVQTIPNIPPGARWTVFCYAVVGPTHVVDAQALRDRLNTTSGRSDWYVIHGQDASNLYFGYYKSVEPGDKDNAAEVQRAHGDMQFVRERKSRDGSKPFERSLFVALDAPDPTAPPEWNLFNVDREKNPVDPKRAFWSLQIMAFRGHQLRKEAAVQAVADLRAKGVEAYYFHGDSVSSVTVGKWTYDAVKEQNRTDEMKDVAHSTAGTPLVVSSIPISEDLEARRIDGKQAVSVAPKLEIQNSDMLRMMQRFPAHAVNYEIGVKRGENNKEYQDPSFLVEIPRAKGNGRFENIQSATPVTADRVGGWGRTQGPSMVNPTGPNR